METNNIEQDETLDKQRVTAYLPLDLWGKLLRSFANARVEGKKESKDTSMSGYIVEAIQQRIEREKTNGG